MGMELPPLAPGAADGVEQEKAKKGFALVWAGVGGGGAEEKEDEVDVKEGLLSRMWDR